MTKADLIKKLEAMDDNSIILVWDPYEDDLTDEVFVKESSINFQNEITKVITIENQE